MNKDLIDIAELSVEEIEFLCDRAEDMEREPLKYSEACRNKKLATLFYEPSTRTRLSFEAAMYELGGSVLGFSSSSSSSVAKGESITDTARVVECFADIIVMRHFKEGAPLLAALHTQIPVINAGDGSHLHPTQTLADLLTIRKQKGSLEGLTVGCCGDLKYGRTVHSLINALSKYGGTRFVFISPPELSLPEKEKKGILADCSVPYSELSSLEEALPELDIIYMTRVQRERFENIECYERLKNSYVLNSEKLSLAKKDAALLHPLPRVGEISFDLDSDPRACHFKQVKNGKLMRKALILSLLDNAQAEAKNDKAECDRAENDREGEDGTGLEEYKCNNSNCVANSEADAVQRYEITRDGRRKCLYCGSLS